MSLDPELAAALEARLAARPPATDLAAMREGFAATGAALPRPAVGAVSDHRVSTPDGEVPVRLYRPDGLARPPLLIFLHGGGFMFGDLDSHEAACQRLVVDAGCAVAAVDYRLAPEHPFPAGLNDCEAAVTWLLDQARALGFDDTRVALGGESAGGNLAAVLARKLAARPGVRPMLQLLVHPLVDFRFQSPSITEVQVPGMGRDAMLMMSALYLGQTDNAHPDASPLLAADLGGVAPAIVVTVEVDPLRDEGEAYALKLAAAGVETTVVRLQSLPHGFMFESTAFRIVDAAFDRIGALLRRGFGAATARQSAV
ncbi:MAG: hydroxyacylglutathione hydrolase [Caulobacter sp.]|nr:hydroxyacylglutathione hydrolase [Caulobacter sp.]